MLDDLGPAAAVRSLVGEWQERTGIPVDFCAAVAPDVRVPPATGIAVYRLAQEALANVERHGEATRVRVALAVHAGQFEVEVRDEQQGEQPDDGEDPRARLALFAMRERIGLVNGRFSVEPAPGGGTTVRAAVPLPDP
jgi:signal transduction histidine kinase